MKGIVKFFGVMVLALAMTGFVACGDDNPADDNGTVEDTQEADTVETDTVGTDTIVEHDTAEEDTNVPPDVTADVCVPNCTVNTCVDDGCGTPCACDTDYICNASTVCEMEVCVPDECVVECGPNSCGTADGCGTCGEGQVCVEMTGTCEDTCVYPDDLPTTWGKTGVVNSLHVPANATEKEPCFDYTGDGLGDCGLTGLASQVNGPLADMMTEGSIAIMFEFANVTDFTATADFTLQGLMGESQTCDAVAGTCTLAGDMWVDEGSYMEDTCMPMIFFEGSSIADGALAAGPGNFTISVPLSADLLLTVHLVNAQIKADITEMTVGVTAADGVLSGVVTKQELTSIIASLEAECAKDPIPEAVADICPYIGVAKSAMAMLFDMHQCDDSEVGCPEGSGTYIAKDAEHPGDAASLCLTFTLAESNITGYKPAE